jgi:glycosyltransferase involved in cell wall biosynthesis
MAPGKRAGVRVLDVGQVTIVETPDLLFGALRSGWDPWEVLNRLYWLRGRRFDLVHAFDCRPTVLIPALWLRHGQHVPLIMDWEDWLGRGGSVEERKNRLVRAVLRPVETYFEERFRTQADGTTVICSTLREKAIALGVSQDEILTLRDGADVEGLLPLNRDICRRELGLSAQEPAIGYIGAIFYRDAQLMARAFDCVRQSVPDARLLLIGYVNVLAEEMVRSPGSILRTGVVDHRLLNLYLAATDLCWLPFVDSGANRGRWPLKLNEYMAAGRPTVATAVGDVKSVMEQYAIGMLAKDTAEDIAEKTVYLLRDRPRRDHLGANSRQIAEEVFDWKLRAADLEQFYERVLDKCSGVRPVATQ